MTKDEKIAKLGKEITDRATVLLGKDKITPDSPEYLGINSALKFTAVKYDEKMADDILDIALTMKKRVPLTIEQLAKKNPQFDRAYLEKAMQAISESGLVEFHWENLDGKNPNHEKRWVLDMFVPGSAEIMMIKPARRVLNAPARAAHRLYGNGHILYDQLPVRVQPRAARARH